MSFSREVKNELAHGLPERECCRRAVCAGLFLGQGRFSAKEGRLYCCLDTSSAACVRLLLRCGRELGIPPAREEDGIPMGVSNPGAEHPAIVWEARRSRRFREEMRYRVRVGPLPATHPFFSRLGLDAALAAFPDIYSGDTGRREAWKQYEYSWVKRRCCKRAFVRGAFLAGGSMGQPGRSYHLEWVARDSLFLETLGALLKELDLGVRRRVTRHYTALYLKSAADIARALGTMGARVSLLAFEEVRAVEETKNQVRRRVNCETANLVRASRAAVRQVAGIRKLQAALGLRGLPDELRGVARARLRWPDASYHELGRKLEPPVSKLAVSRCLLRLEKLALGLGSRAARTDHED